MTVVEPDHNLFVAEAPPGLEFGNSDTLLNPSPIDGFDPRFTQDVEGLLFLGQIVDTFELMGHNFVLKTLTRGERLAVALLAKEYDETLGMGLAYETGTVAASLTMVDGRPLSPALSSSENPIARIRTNFEVICKWFDPVIEALFLRYSNLLLRQAQAFAELQRK